MESQHATPRIIKDIKNDDVKIQVTGHVKEIENETLIINDKTGEISVDIKNAIGQIENISKNDLINVIGELILSMDGEKVINASIIQDMKNLNFSYYQKLYEIKKELEKSNKM